MAFLPCIKICYFFKKIYTDKHDMYAFNAHNLYIFDLASHSLLYQGHYKNGRYKKRWSLQNTCHSILFACFVCRPKFFLFMASSLRTSFRKKKLSSTFKFQSSFCKRCALGKSTCIPFQLSNEIKTSFPFTLVHSDIWQLLHFLLLVLNIMSS